MSEPRQVFARIITELGGIPPRVPVAAGKDSSTFGEAADISQLPEVAALRQLVTGHLIITPGTAKNTGGALVPRAAGAGGGARGAAGGPMVGRCSLTL